MVFQVRLASCFFRKHYCEYKPKPRVDNPSKIPATGETPSQTSRMANGAGASFGTDQDRCNRRNVDLPGRKESKREEVAPQRAGLGHVVEHQDSRSAVIEEGRHRLKSELGKGTDCSSSVKLAARVRARGLESRNQCAHRQCRAQWQIVLLRQKSAWICCSVSSSIRS